MRCREMIWTFGGLNDERFTKRQDTNLSLFVAIIHVLLFF